MLALVAVLAAPLPAAPADAETTPATESARSMLEDFPEADGDVRFEPNEGQFDPVVDAAARRPGVNYFLTDGDLRIDFPQRREAVAMSFVDRAARPEMQRGRPTGVAANYLVGEPDRWRPAVATMSDVVFAEIYPGVAVRYLGEGPSLRYDLLVAAGADPGQIKLRFDGADPAIEDDGRLRLRTERGNVLHFAPPHSHQRFADGPRTVESRFVIHEGVVSFSLGRYDAERPLVIDPTLEYASLIGGTGTEFIADIAVDTAGNPYVIGYTSSVDYPTTVGAYQTTKPGNNDVVVSKFSTDGTSLVWSTYLGAASTDVGYHLDVDSSGAVYLQGHTSSLDFPITAGAFDTTHNGGTDTFVTKLSADGSSLVWSTFLGGSASNDYGDDIVVTPSGRVLAVGQTDSPDFPTTAGAYDTGPPVGVAAYVTMLAADGASLVWSTLLDGASTDRAWSVAIEPSGRVVVGGRTQSSAFPTTAGAYDTGFNGAADAFLAVLAADGSSLDHSTFLGGASTDGIAQVVVLGNDHYVLGGATLSSTFPTTPGAHDTVMDGLGDAWAAELDLTLSGPAQLVWSTLIGGTDTDSAIDIGVDADGSVALTGQTKSTGIATAGAFDTSHNGSQDAFVAKLAADGSTLSYLSYLGSSGGDIGRGLALDSGGRLWAAGIAASADFPTTPDALDATWTANEGFIVRFQWSPSIVVNSTADGGDASPGDGMCQTATPGQCTLRAAVQEANANAGLDQIRFSLPKADPGYTATPMKWTINPATVIPAITQPVTIDASTQPGFAGAPVVVLDGSGTSFTTHENALQLDAGATTIRGFAFHHWDDDAIEVETTGDTTIVGNYFGLDVDGMTVLGGGWGVNLKADGNVVGGSDPADANVFAGHSEAAIWIYQDAADNRVQGNLIGTDASGALALGNDDDGITVFDGAENNLIGGTGPGEGNLITASGGRGVTIAADAGAGNTILGNAIHANGALGIDLGGDGVDTNDPGDGDGGPNDRLNHPANVVATTYETAVLIGFELDAPAGGYRVEVFSNPGGPDPSGYGEGQVLAGVDSFVHTGSGPESFQLKVAAGLGDRLALTVTERFAGPTYGSTSEFSAVVDVTAGQPAAVVSDASAARSDLEATGGFDPTQVAGGIVAGAAKLDGLDDALVGPPLEMVGPGLSMSGWIQRDGAGKNPRLVAKSAGDGMAVYELLVDAATDEAVARLDLSPTVEVRGGSLADTGWHFLAATWDGAELVLYVDGKEVDRQVAVGTVAGDLSVPAVVGNTSYATRGVSGVLDEVRLRHTALSPSDVALQFANVAGPTAVVMVGELETEAAPPWTVSAAQTRSGVSAMAAPITTGAAPHGWAVADGIDEPGVEFESWWWLDPTGTLEAAAGTRAGAVPIEQYETTHVDGSGWELGRRVGGSTIQDVGPTGSAPSGTWVKVVIRTDQNHQSSVWIDGVELIGPTAQGTSLTSGSVALRAGRLDPGEAWYVDDAKARRLVTIEPVTSLAPMDRM